MSMNERPLTFTGTIVSIGPIVKVTEKFRKQEFVMTDASAQYPQHVQFELSQNRVDLMNNYKVGSYIEATFNLNGRQWTNPQGEVKTFNTLSVWRISAVPVDKQQTQSYVEATSPVHEKPEDDLPF